MKGSIATDTEQKEGQTMPANNSKKATVLFVDDSKLMRRAAQSALSTHYDVLLAVDGVDAMKAIHEHSEIQAIITDLSMPEMDGHELIRKIKTSTDARLRSLPMLVVTGSATDEVIKQVRQAGAAGVMTKPFTPEALVERVRQLLAVGENDAASASPQIESVDALNGHICVESSAAELERRLRQTVALHVRHDLPLAVMQLSITNLQAIESSHGESVGRSVMKFAEKILGQTLRDEDSVGQTSTDTFTLVLPMTTASGAEALSDRLEQAFRKKKVAFRGQVIELEVELALCDPGLSEQDIECIAAGKDKPGLMTNVVKFELPANEKAAPAASAPKAQAAAV
jgi:diguanylate cyclase (GGDEF)-like protein